MSYSEKKKKEQCIQCINISKTILAGNLFLKYIINASGKKILGINVFFRKI